MPRATLADHWVELLPLSHREALYDAAVIFIDEFFLGYQSDGPVVGTGWVDDLPARYKSRYDWPFGQRFLACLTVLAWKLAQSQPPIPLLDCVAEELAMHVLIERAKVALELEGINDIDFGGFEDDVFPDADFEYLFDDSMDGIDEGEIGAKLGMADLSFSGWFEPFLNAGSRLHPYLEEGPERST